MWRILMIRFLPFLVGIVLGVNGSLALAEDLTPEDYNQFWKPGMGTWKMTSDSFGQVTTGTFTMKYAPNKNCILLYHGSGDGPFTQQLQGYDPVSKKQIAFGFSGNGDFQIQTITVDGMKKGMKAAKGVGGDWEHKLFSTDGTTTTTTFKWKWEQLDKDKIVIVWFDARKNGQPVAGENRMTLQRQK
jgi:hypothetical protein